MAIRCPRRQSFGKIYSSHQTVAILYFNNDWGIDVAKVFQDQFTSLGEKVVAQESFDLNTKDYKTQLSKIKSTHPDNILLLVYPGQALNVFTQTQELNISAQLFAPGWVVEDNSVLDTTKSLMENIIYAVPQMPVTQEFKDKLIANYGNESENPLVAALAYDSFNLITQAIDRCGEDTSCIKGFLYQTKNYPGTAGPITLDANGDITDIDFTIKTIRNGEMVEY